MRSHSGRVGNLDLSVLKRGLFKWIGLRFLFYNISEKAGE
jgi:hypothetical protein